MSCRFDQDDHQKDQDDHRISIQKDQDDHQILIQKNQDHHQYVRNNFLRFKTRWSWSLELSNTFGLLTHISSRIPSNASLFRHATKPFTKSILLSQAYFVEACKEGRQRGLAPTSCFSHPSQHEGDLPLYGDHGMNTVL